MPDLESPIAFPTPITGVSASASSRTGVRKLPAFHPPRSPSPCEPQHVRRGHEKQTKRSRSSGRDHAAKRCSFRHTEQAILQVLNSAQSRILLVSYAVYSIPNIQDAVVRAARRGVKITVVVETPDKLDVQNEYSTLQALGDDVARCSAVYYWPKENRKVDSLGKLGILHVKCVVGDGRWLFLSSANLTKYAFTLNMELGLLVTGGDLAGRVQRHFDQLITDKVLIAERSGSVCDG